VRRVPNNERTSLLERAYVLFNQRDIAPLLALMVDDVGWPDVTNDVELHSKPAIRAYWEGQFAVAQPQVVPTEFIEVGDDVVATVDQRVFDLDDKLIGEPMTVFHRYSFRGRLISRMVVHQRREYALAP
jgi:hypothetical protein